MRETSQIEIDGAALDWNLDCIRSMVGGDCAICPVIKADAYGHRAELVAARMVAWGGDMLAVYAPEEALSLKEVAGDVPRLVIMPVRGEDRLRSIVQRDAAHNLHFMLHDLAQLDDFVGVARQHDSPINVHVEIDTGMSRGGCPGGEALDMVRRVSTVANLRLAGLSTHFASSESDPHSSELQLRAFDCWLETMSDLVPDNVLIHVSNTCAMLRNPRFHRSMVRVGLGWTGYGPQLMIGDHEGAGDAVWRPVLRWKSEIIQVKTIPAGRRVGYGGRWTAPRETTLGLVPVGYACGYPMVACRCDDQAGGGVVGIELRNGGLSEIEYAPVIGALSMDQMTIDLTDLVPTDGGSASLLGASIELIAADADAPNSLVALANVAKVIPYQLLCGINAQIPRVMRPASSLRQTVEAKPAIPAEIGGRG
jgi:alanine racemase